MRKDETFIIMYDMIIMMMMMITWPQTSPHKSSDFLGQ